MGSDVHYPEERPSRDVAVDRFWMDEHLVTNSEFKRFIEATGYVSVAERPLDPRQFPGVDQRLLRPGGAVFRQPTGPGDAREMLSWWAYVPGASWRHPDGPDSKIDGRDFDPVVQVALEDAATYAAWAGKDLPTEAEWEFAARGGLEGAAYCWGDTFTPDGRWMANTWQGEFPWENLEADGFPGRSPVGSFPPNGYGLFDMTGNVWEWTSDWHAGRHPDAATGSCCVARNPRGTSETRSYDPAELGLRIPRKVIKGGSYLCAPNYCRRYRPAARHPQPIDTATCHIGFRCVARVEIGNSPKS